jgi:hypothetical protein
MSGCWSYLLEMYCFSAAERATACVRRKGSGRIFLFAGGRWVSGVCVKGERRGRGGGEGERYVVMVVLGPRVGACWGCGRFGKRAVSVVEWIL